MIIFIYYIIFIICYIFYFSLIISCKLLDLSVNFLLFIDNVFNYNRKFIDNILYVLPASDLHPNPIEDNKLPTIKIIDCIKKYSNEYKIKNIKFQGVNYFEDIQQYRQIEICNSLNANGIKSYYTPLKAHDNMPNG